MKNIKKKEWSIPEGVFHMATKCYNCAGSGYNVCPVCNGSKTVNGETSSSCGGKGLIDCPVCKGTGINED